MTTLALSPARVWQQFPRETIAAGLLAGVGALGIAVGVITLGGSKDAAAAEAPPPPPAMTYQQVSADEAMRLNAALPVNAPVAGAAQPFTLSVGGAVAKANALECLTQAVYYEAGQEPTDGQRGVAQVVLNRVRHPAFPASVCGVVYQGSTRQTGCQFTFTCDGSLLRQPDAAAWNRARKVAEAALNGSVYPAVGNATHYHAKYVMPYWAPTLAKTAVVGAHIFYRWNGGWGQPGAFNQRYNGLESNPSALRSATLAIVRTQPVTPVSNPAVLPIAKVEGVTVREEAGGKRVRVHFTQEARAAVEKVAEKRTPYVEKVQASDNLRYALGGDTAPQGETLGRARAPDPSVKAN